MCLIVFSYRDHPRYDLVFAANRDEFFGRPTRAATFWDDNPHLLAGKDLKAGGTWMGITRQGRLSALTNFRDMRRREEKPTSRGHLVLDFLENGTAEAVDYLEKVHREADRYNGFNLLAGSVCRLMYYSNREQAIRRLQPGLYGLSNHLLDTPWPKVERAKIRLREILEAGEPEAGAIFELLQDGRKAPEEELPDTGLPPDREKAVSPIFIRAGDYGTRSSTLVTVDKKGNVRFEERRYRKEDAGVAGRDLYEFKLER